MLPVIYQSNMGTRYLEDKPELQILFYKLAVFLEARYTSIKLNQIVCLKVIRPFAFVASKEAFSRRVVLLLPHVVKVDEFEVRRCSYYYSKVLSFLKSNFILRDCAIGSTKF